MLTLQNLLLLWAHFVFRLSKCEPFSRQLSAENENNEETFYILLIQSMEKFSLMQTTDEDCYRVATKIGRWKEKKKKSNEKICQDLEIKV